MKLLLSISEDIKKDPAVLAQFMDNSFTELKERYCDLDASLLSVSELSLKKRIDHYLEEYGFRCMNELKLEEPSLMEKPDFIFMMLKNYAKVDENNTGVDEVAIKNAAEKRVREALKGKYCLKIIPRQFIFNRVLNFSRKGVSFREYQRFARTKMFGIARFVFNAMGRKFFALNVIADPKDIFWLTTEEIFSFVEGYAVSKNLKGIVSARKEEYAGYNDDLGQRIFTRGAVYTNRFKDETADRFVFDEKEGVLRGTSCCPGIVRGRVKVIRSPNDDMSLDNEILVAGKTDPGWVPLYPAAKGVLIERGSILSHSSIVAREMGLPAIVGIPGILEVLKTGDEVEMDGAAGTVTILNRE
jgi:pyruvate,water dikinase